MIYEEVTIKDFIDAWFNENYTKLPKDFFEICYSEYIDTAGLFATEEFDKVAYITYLNNRINYIKICLYVHRLSIEKLGEQLVNNFVMFEEYGYIIESGKNVDILRQLDNIERSESIQKSYFDSAIKDLDNIRKSKSIGSEGKKRSIKDTRHSFLTMIHSLCKIGYKIDIDKNTVEDLALIVKKQMEDGTKYAN